MIIAIGADHRGFEHKEYIKKMLASELTQFNDLGAYSTERSDYPEYAIAVAKRIQQKEADCGILLCGSGVGMSIVANRFAGIYAGLVWDIAIAREAKEDDNVNVLVIPADAISMDTAIEIVVMWMAAQFKSGHYQDRLNSIDALGGIK